MNISQTIKFSHARYFFENLSGCFLKSKYHQKGGQSAIENVSQVKKNAVKPLKQELKNYRAHGIALYLDGKPSSPKSIAKACNAAEGGGYMRDYTEDENGRIARVDFDFIRNT